MVKCVAQSKICLVSSLDLGSLAHFVSFVKYTIHLECALHCCLLIVLPTLTIALLFPNPVMELRPNIYK